MVRLDCLGGSASGVTAARTRSARASARSAPAAASPAANPLARPVADPVPWDCPGAAEIGFDIPERYNASDVLFHNLAAGRADRLAVTGPAGARSYAQLAADAVRWGNALLALGLACGDRVLRMFDDTPVYPAAFFGAVRAGLVPILINLLTPPELLRFYLADSQGQGCYRRGGILRPLRRCLRRRGRFAQPYRRQWRHRCADRRRQGDRGGGLAAAICRTHAGRRYAS